MKIVALALAAGCTLVLAPGAGADRPRSAVSRPHALQLWINGKRFATTPLGEDSGYRPVRFKTMKVQAKWTGSATGSGYVVRISTTEPSNTVYARCAKGTTCLVPHQVPIQRNDDWSWVIELVKAGSNHVVAGFQVCLERDA